jgi:damage-control phosphatase, subfamily I
LPFDLHLFSGFGWLYIKRMQRECLQCQMESLPLRMEKFGITEEEGKKLMAELKQEIQQIDFKNSNAPEITRNILDKIRSHSTVADPYRMEKKESNRKMLARYEEFQQKVRNSDDPFDTALRLAIAGNIIDFGPNHVFHVDEVLEKVLTGRFAIDHSRKLKAAIEKAEILLYLGDNCGEIVLDKLFLETLGHPHVWFAVREKPVLNDATPREARETGIHEVATVITNGDDCPSTVLHRVSREFREIYDAADLIISKGMGNYEGLMNEKDPRLFFLMMIKCQVIGNLLGVQKGDFIVRQNIP